MDMCEKISNVPLKPWFSNCEMKRMLYAVLLAKEVMGEFNGMSSVCLRTSDACQII